FQNLPSKASTNLGAIQLPALEPIDHRHYAHKFTPCYILGGYDRVLSIITGAVTLDVYIVG
ncbi:hypothetical protein, partial [Oceaniovalibus sp. ACAM 378]|uniref:hypothetical protein n=1 Tax=Oceaniovalibus sp. ACAM 378 TaxID=2599923 RepID=UPI001CA32383